MSWLKRNIPNAITCGNLFCGCLAIVKAFEGDLVWAAYLVGIAAVLDFFDGFAARLLKATSPIGKDLDSLADMVTFGVVPGIVMFQILIISLRTSNPDGDDQSRQWVKYLAFLIPVFSAIRLAKFNNDTRQTESFIGLPTPANAIFFCSLPLVLKQISDEVASSANPFAMLVEMASDPVLAILHSVWFLLILTVCFSLLLVAPLPLFSLKFKSFGWKGNEIRYIFLILSVAMVSFLQFKGSPLVIVLYLVMSAAQNLFLKAGKKRKLEI
jgi:CDP-diacylglycerol---serine O-phosphatidyltransferase